MKHLWILAALLALSGTASAQTAKPDARPTALSAHVKQDVLRHRAMAAAHEAAARCLEAGTPEKTCQAELEMTCKGLALGKLCGMRHEH